MTNYKDNRLTIDGTTFNLSYPIADAVEYGDRIIVLFDPDAYTSKFGQFRNVAAISRQGTMLWHCELPSTTSGDRYYRLKINGGIKAASVYSELCELDAHSGKILNKEFLK